MTQARLLFDECIGKPHVECLANLVAFEQDEDRPLIKHLLDFQGQGVRDEEWIPRMAAEQWMLITADRGRKRRGKGEPLSRVCVREGVTHIILSAVVQRRRSFEKMLTVLSVWYEVLAAYEEPRGSRFVIEPQGNRPENRGKGKLIRRDVPPRKAAPGMLPFPTE